MSANPSLNSAASHTGLGWPAPSVARVAPRVRLRRYPPSLAQWAWLSHHPGLFAAWGALAGPAEFLQSALASLPHRDIELVNLRSSWNAGGYYHWGFHLFWTRVRRKGPAYRDGLMIGPEAPCWSDRESTLLRAVDELHDDVAISAPTLARLRAFYGERELIEICFITGHYELLAMTYESIGLPYDGLRLQRPPTSEWQPRRPCRRPFFVGPCGNRPHEPTKNDERLREWFPRTPSATAVLEHHPNALRLLRLFGRNTVRFASLEPHDHDLIVHRTVAAAGPAEELPYVVASAAGSEDHRGATLVRAVDELSSEYFVSDETWPDLSAVLDARQLIELCFLVGHYRTFAMIVNSLATS